MLVSDLAEAEGGRSGEKTLIDRESITAEISHDTIRWICAAGIKWKAHASQTSGSGSILNSPLDRFCSIAARQEIRLRKVDHTSGR